MRQFSKLMLNSFYITLPKLNIFMIRMSILKVMLDDTKQVKGLQLFDEYLISTQYVSEDEYLKVQLLHLMLLLKQD